MTKNSRYYLFLTALITLNALSTVCTAQTAVKDSVFKNILLNEVIVTATKTEKSIGDIPVPIQVISKKFIQQSGSQKLIDILQQHTGLILADNPLGQSLQGYPNPFGSGIQLQGLDPAYTLILLDGEPLTGRNAGILNLGRVSVGNIKQVEIVKGPATSLYGSDALAGVINIITEKPVSNNTSVQFHHATNNTWGITASQNIVSKKLAVNLFANRYSSSGYDLDNTLFGKTQDPHHNYSFAAKLIYQATQKTTIQTSARLFFQKQFNNYLIYPNPPKLDTVNGSTKEIDWSLNNQISHRFTDNAKIIGRVYITGYQNNASVYLQHNNTLYDNAFLHQFLIKPELQVEFGKKHNQQLIAGVGYNYETVHSSRYASGKIINSFYSFIQKEWVFNNKLNITLGARFDKNSLYKAQFNPKLSLAYKPTNRLTFMGSIGSGFKAPDFRQQFLSFSNAVIGYTILGATELSNSLIKMQQLGQLSVGSNISQYINNPQLLPEKSIGINLGARFQASKKLCLNANFFRNDIKNLIEYYQLDNVQKSNGSGIYSYKNINKVFTTGFDVNIQYSFNRAFSVSTGYQYLIAKDKDIIEKIKNKEIYKRDPATYESSTVGLSDYGGLFNRSKHTANFQVFYHNERWQLDISTRATYKGRFGFIGKKDHTGNVFNDGNNILDDDRKYAEGYFNLNTSIAKKINKILEVQVGADNILNYINRETLPNLFGRAYFINLNIRLNQSSKK